MENSLIEQSHITSKFIKSAWPGLLGAMHEAITPWVDEIEEVLLCGCGDSHHAALGLEFAFDLWSGRRIRAAPAMFTSRYLVPRLEPPARKTLVIGISASGEVARTNEAIILANEMEAKTMAFTSNPDSSLGQVAKVCVSIPTPTFTGPGLLSYISSLLMGYACCGTLAREDHREEIISCIGEVPALLDHWIPSELEKGFNFAQATETSQEAVFIAGGSLFGSANFSAAKAIESAGAHAWAQEIEEWAHLEYFCEPSDMPTWFLTAGGRTESREQEVFEAARVIGRRMNISRWEGEINWNSNTREALAPLALWAGPVAYAARLAELWDEKPFRGFGGGRSHVEGGGVSRIRSSLKISSLRDLKG